MMLFSNCRLKLANLNSFLPDLSTGLACQLYSSPTVSDNPVTLVNGKAL